MREYEDSAVRKYSKNASVSNFMDIEEEEFKGKIVPKNKNIIDVNKEHEIQKIFRKENPLEIEHENLVNLCEIF